MEPVPQPRRTGARGRSGHRPRRVLWGHRPPSIARARSLPGCVRALSNPGGGSLLDRRDGGGIVRSQGGAPGRPPGTSCDRVRSRAAETTGPWAAFSPVRGHRVGSGVASPRLVMSPGVSLRSPPNAPLSHAPQPAGKTTTCGSRISPLSARPRILPAEAAFLGKRRVMLGKTLAYVHPARAPGLATLICCVASTLGPSGGERGRTDGFSAVVRWIRRRLARRLTRRLAAQAEAGRPGAFGSLDRIAHPLRRTSGTR
jgi:hypothetical protein